MITTVCARRSFGGDASRTNGMPGAVQVELRWRRLMSCRLGRLAHLFTLPRRQGRDMRVSDQGRWHRAEIKAGA